MFWVYLSLCLILADFTEHMCDLLNRNCIAHMPNAEHIQKKPFCLAWASFPLAPKSEISVKANSTVWPLEKRYSYRISLRDNKS